MAQSSKTGNFHACNSQLLSSHFRITHLLMLNLHKFKKNFYACICKYPKQIHPNSTNIFTLYIETLLQCMTFEKMSMHFQFILAYLNHCAKNEVFYWRSFQKMWPNPQENAGLATVTEESFIENFNFCAYSYWPISESSTFAFSNQSFYLKCNTLAWGLQDY